MAPSVRTASSRRSCGPTATRMSKYPSVSRASARHPARTALTGAGASSANSPRLSRLIALSGRYVLKVASTQRSQAKAASSATGSTAGARTSMPIGRPMICSTRITRIRRGVRGMRGVPLVVSITPRVVCCVMSVVSCHLYWLS